MIHQMSGYICKGPAASTSNSKSKFFTDLQKRDIYYLLYGKYFDPRKISSLSSVIVWMRIVFRKTVVDYLVTNN